MAEALQTIVSAADIAAANALRDDLLTLIDACDAATTNFVQLRSHVIWDAHDLAHLLLGGDAERRPWLNLRVAAQDDFEAPSPHTSASDVARRVLDLLSRVEANDA